MPSRPGEFHPESLTDPDVILAHHPARAAARRLPPSAERQEARLPWLKDGTPVVILYSVQNGGHAMPLEGEDLDSPVVIWDFFSKLPSR